MRRDDLATAAQLFAAIPWLPRAELARLTERMIERMDEIDGDPDLEDDDPAGGNVEDERQVEDWRPEGIMLGPPKYAVDQSLGPINEKDVTSSFHHRLRVI